MPMTFVLDTAFLMRFLAYAITVILFREMFLRISGRDKDSKRKSPKTIPNAPWLPILGSLPFMGRHASRVISKWSREKGLGTIFNVRFATMHAIVLNDYKSIRECFVKNGHHLSGRQQSPLVVELWKGNGLIFLDYGEKWKNQSKFCHSTFRKVADSEKLRKIVAEETETMVNAMKTQLCGKQDTDGAYSYGNFRKALTDCEEKGCECRMYFDGNNNFRNEWKCFNPNLALHQVNMNVTCRILFGRTIRPHEKEYSDVLADTPIQARKSFAAFMMVFLVPFLRNVPPIRGIIDEALKLRRATFDMIENVVQEHILHFDGVADDANFINCYLNEIIHQQDKSGNSYFTYQQLHAVLFDIFNAGAETSSSTLKWTLLYLARDTGLQAEIREEINKEHPHGSVYSGEAASSLHLTRATILETTRIRPLNSLGVPHKATADCDIMGFKVPTGSVLMPNVWSVHHNPEVFPNPEVFDPRRHLNDSGRFAPNKHVIGFSMGPRRCLGRRISEISMLSILATIIRRFEFRLPRVWNGANKRYETADFDFSGTDGQILLPPDYWLEWRAIS